MDDRLATAPARRAFLCGTTARMQEKAARVEARDALPLLRRENDPGSE
jgi:hypothetical protein